ncbi:N-acetylmuramoyl-L-alanine amidase [endosymbiont 'TC1' of Trimyema compressum]|uniref:N-acetylmuramoyl-L-alanine amidase n=1 Tax=endosymbiont 'TC1' of Trimyema compressum TaxID=243899 RepID=UPI00247FDE55|nr:N-acetylmuramoyl-L-alanine amidase [endosymbiont 'TC1' of Trimyema compressum]
MDPGYGIIDSYYNNNFDPGAVQNGLYESASNMWLAAELAQQLRAAGANVYLTREYEYSLVNAP